MIIYKSTKKEFIEHAMSPEPGRGIADMIRAEFEKRIGKVNKGEYLAWRNSLRHMAMIVKTDAIDDETTVCIEYRLPYQNTRIDFLIAGRDGNGQEHVVIVELKQWSEATPVDEASDIVRTAVNGAERNLPHPSYQAWSYAVTLQEYNECVQDDGILLHPCAFMHNYVPLDGDPIIDNTVYRIIDKSPLFTRANAEELIGFISSYVSRKDDKDLVGRIDYGRLHPSKSLQDVLANLLDSKKQHDEFVLIDSQKSIFEFILGKILRLRNEDSGKQVFIVSGGPGTGKSVLAINLLAAAINDGKMCAYVSKNSAPRNVYTAKLAAGSSFSKTYIGTLFKGSGSFVDSSRNAYDVLIVDEAHRLNGKSGLFAKGENQIKEIINAARISVFFIDEDQIVTAKDIGSVKEITRFAKEAHAKRFVSRLESQFRCNGSDGYLSFLDDALGIRSGEYTFNPAEYDIEIYDDLGRMFADIKRLNLKDNKARMLAGYCWNWISKEDRSSGPDIVIEDQGFKAYWNFSNTATWAIDDDTIDQVGCIHTSQGLEFSYVGVIIGNDLRFENGHVITDPSKRARTDSSLKGFRITGEELAARKDKIIRDTYRTLLSRGMKGCYVFCMDKALSEYLKRKLDENSKIYYDFASKLGTGMSTAENGHFEA